MYDLKKMKCKLCYSLIFLIERNGNMNYSKKLFLLHENRKIVHGICDGKFVLKIRFLLHDEVVSCDTKCVWIL